MNILGIWDGHDSGAALLCDGRLVAAVNEERLTRRKLEVRFPAQSIASCLALAHLSPHDIDLVAASTTDPAKTLARWYPESKESYYQIRRRRAEPGWLTRRMKAGKYWVTESGPFALTKRLSEAALTRDLRALGLTRARLALFDHHHCHGVGAALASGFDACAVVTIDGVGDGLSATVARYEQRRLTRVAASAARDSLGVFFEHVTNLLNMRELEDEGKVMALADYAAPVPDAENPMLALFNVRDGQVRAAIPGRSMQPHLRSILWRYPNEQFAYMAQRTVEEVCVRLARDAVRLAGSRRLALAGGVASNVKANRRVRLLPEVDTVYVFPHMGDGGLAVGAALAAAQALGVQTCHAWNNLGFGPAFADDETAAALARALLTPSRPHDLPAHVAMLVAAGKIVLWFQGRMELGPRALGHRSVLARPDRADIRDRLNLVLKQRVWYQPFCPSMLESEAHRVLADYCGAPNPHMTMAYIVRPEFRAALAGVTSVDGSCRPQMVSDGTGGPFTAFLREMKAATGLGVVLNTSCNIHGEPIVCTPDEAVRVFRQTRADALAIGPWLVTHDAPPLECPVPTAAATS